MTAASSKGKMPTRDPSVPRLSDPCKNLIELFARAPEMSGLAFPEVKNAWDAFFNGWKQILTAPLPNPFSAAREVEDLIGLSKPWPEGFTNFQKALCSCLETAAAVCSSPEGGREGAAGVRSTWMKCCEELTSAWLSFMADQTKAFIRFTETRPTERRVHEN